MSDVKATVKDVWIDKYGRVRVSMLYESEQEFEMDIPDKDE